MGRRMSKKPMKMKNNSAFVNGGFKLGRQKKKSYGNHIRKILRLNCVSRLF